MPLSSLAAEHVEHAWDGIVPVLEQYVTIPNVSIAFDPEWAEHGHMQRAVELVRDWCASRAIDGATVAVHELDGRTPVIVVEVPAFGDAPADDTVVLYGHLDKQPEMHGWRDGLGPWTPVIEGDRLYGRGGADDGYAAFASLAAIEAVRAGGGAHARCIVLIEASEESGSPDLPAHVEALADRIGTPSFVVCLDSGCIDYDRMWLTTSLRGIVNLTLSVDVVREGLHSGESGMIPSTFRIARMLLSRIEDEATGRVLLETCDVAIPDDRVAEAEATAKEIGTIADRYPFVDGAQPMTPDGAEQLLGRTWRAALSVIGADGLPPTAVAGNVLRPNTTLELSLRTPPTADADAVVAELHQRLLAERRARRDQSRRWRVRLELAAARPVVDGRPRRRVGRRLRTADADVRRGRHDPVHGDARRALPRRPVRDHRCARPRRQRPRTERVPPPTNGAQDHARNSRAPKRSRAALKLPPVAGLDRGELQAAAVFVGPCAGARRGRDDDALVAARDAALLLVEYRQRVVEAVRAQCVRTPDDRARLVEHRRRVAAPGVVHAAGNLVGNTLAGDVRREDRPAHVSRLQRAVDEEVCDRHVLLGSRTRAGGPCLMTAVALIDAVGPTRWWRRCTAALISPPSSAIRPWMLIQKASTISAANVP